MLQQVFINGFEYFADMCNRILYNDREKNSGVPFSYMTENERQQLERSLRIGRPKCQEF